MIKFGSACSGIEAASVAWNPFGWEASWFSEIEPFPCALLKHHYPNVPNVGDMYNIRRLLQTRLIDAPELFVAGTPCQSFSLAGKRQSLDDNRGNLTLEFIEVANEIDHIRQSDNEQECVIFWENVPGVLNTKDNAFGCFLAGLAGETVPLEPSGNKWSNAGYVIGPKRTIAWRILDAQYFGVAQRRRRVFVVASARKGFDPRTVLFESEDLRRDIAPSRESKETTTFNITAEFVKSGCWWNGGQLSQTLDAVLYKGQTMPEKNRFPAVLQQMRVRKLTPLECERLQGFPDNYTCIPYRNKSIENCPDGPRYKAIGNSWAVPVIEWIGLRLYVEMTRHE